MAQPFDIPHLAFPIRVANGTYVTEQQGSLDCAITAVRTICAFEVGSRIERPDFGIPDPTLKDQPIDVGGIEKAIMDWEPRVDAFLTLHSDPATGVETLDIKVTLPYSEED